MTAPMSVLGLYNYDDTIFDNMVFPEAMTTTEKTDTINNIILECAELEVLYTNPAFMKFAIQTWSRKELPTWIRVYNASVAEYDPIENYNRYEESTQTTDMTRQHSGNDTRRMVIDQSEVNRGADTVANTGTDTTAHSGNDTTTHSGKDTTQLSGTDGSHTVIDADEVHTGTDTTTNTGSDVTTNQIAGFDSNTLVDHDKSTLAHGHGTSLLHGESVATDTTEDITITHGKKEELTHGHSEQLTHGHTEQLTHGHTETTTHGHAIDTDADNTETTTHGLKIEDDGDVTTESHIHGNIGVTTSQQMLESELLIAPKLNIINYITESFKKRFCLLVY